MRPSTTHERVRAAADLIDAFLLRTGVVGDAGERRYLWTDAFAVCTLLGLDAAGASPSMGDERYATLALRLVDRVHRVLGRHRDDDPRNGWISGLSEEEGALHPTAGGLRIGKPLPERPPDETLDPGLEWERDGQYFHYLTRWMHALRRVAVETGERRYLDWAVELARAAHDGFVHRDVSGRGRMHWKMSIDLSRPLVPSMGQHDPLDGYLTLRTLTAPAAPFEPIEVHDLEAEIASFASLAGLHDPTRWVTADPLGLGGLLVDAHRVALLRAEDAPETDGLLFGLVAAVDRGFASFRRDRPLDRPRATRLPFRELGLALGIHAAERVPDLLDRIDLSERSGRIEAATERILEHRDMAHRIETAWSAPESRALDVWSGHEDINAVMLATSLLPDGYLRL